MLQIDLNVKRGSNGTPAIRGLALSLVAAGATVPSQSDGWSRVTTLVLVIVVLVAGRGARRRGRVAGQRR